MCYLIHNPYVFIRIGPRIIPFDPLHVKWIESDRNYVYIIMADGRKEMLRSTLENIGEKFSNRLFCQANRSTIVNFAYIKEVCKSDIIIGDKIIFLHKKYASVFLQKLLSNS